MSRAAMLRRAALQLNFQPAKGRKNSGMYRAQNDLDTPTAATAMAPQGYGMDPNVTTWGGGILVERSIGKNETVYHLYVSRMTNECPLANWQTNSRVDHAVSNSITGPYTFQDVAIPTFSPTRIGNSWRSYFHCCEIDN